MKFSKRCLLPVLALILSGCAGYRVGSSLPESIQSVSIAVENKTDEPSVEVQVMKSLRAELQMDGRLDVRPQSDADAILTVTLNRYQLTPVAFDHKQGSLAREYRVTLS
ncbi:MAG: LPS assembly lipoprotein LptE, partial [Kiritimatiellales bacterium]